MPYLEFAVIALLDSDEDKLIKLQQKVSCAKNTACFRSPFELHSFAEEHEVDVVITSRNIDSASGLSLMNTLRAKNPNLIFVFIVEELEETTRQFALKSGVSEIFEWSQHEDAIATRLKYLIKRKNSLKISDRDYEKKLMTRLPRYKRIFDVTFASLLIVIIAPLLLLIAILIKLESRGPVIYYSSRVGTGYRIFKFYKFRSMRLNADQQLKNISHLNQYDQGKKSSVTATVQKCQYCQQNGIDCRSVLYADGKEYCENLYQLQGIDQSSATFIKIKNDPRITRVGQFIRNTSFDELPQLFNVLIGDMSIVGNRPLPLYEAEKLTTDQFSERFNAPAGITGLWQVSKRGQGKMTEEERIALDNQYARSYSLWLDLQILFKTVFALVQKENV